MTEVKKNVKFQAAVRDKASGKTLLQNMELLPVIIDFIEFSAGLPSDEEFHCLWSSIFQRMRSKEEKTDWNEPEMEKYLRKNIFESEGEYITASWRSGICDVPLGYTTYAPNAIEVSHRVLKGLFTAGYERRSVGALIVEVCQAMSTRHRLVNLCIFISAGARMQHVHLHSPILDRVCN